MARGKGKFKCPKCERVFGMKAHLGRHLNTIHGTGGARKAKTGPRRGPGRPKGSGKKRAVGRPSGLVSRLGLRDMSLEQLGEVILAARNEAQNRIVEYQQTFA